MNFFLFNLNILIVKKVLLQINVNVNVPGFIFFYITDIVLYVVTQNYNTVSNMKQNDQINKLCFYIWTLWLKFKICTFVNY